MCHTSFLVSSLQHGLPSLHTPTTQNLIMSQNPPPNQTSRHHHHHLHLHKKQTTTTLPDFLLTALSLFLLVSSPSKPLSLPHHHPRRFLKLPTMSLANPNPNPNPNRRFATPQSLSDWLKPRLPADSFASWGVKPGTKNVHNLFLELSEGETTLVDDDSAPPVRTLDVVIVRIIGSNNRILIESCQELSDGSVRDRNRPLSEKMKPGENPEAAAARAVREELGSVIGGGDGDVRIVQDSYVKKVEERVSVSYPGLPARYVLHSVDAFVDGLPEREFCTEEGAEYEDSDENRLADAALSCRKHYWKWVDANSI